MTAHSRLGALLLTTLCAAPLYAQDGRDNSREQAALSEEQELLHRQLQRLEGSMESLAERFETEGRVHAAGLLRKGLSHVTERGDQGAASLPELMEDTTGELRGGRVHQSLEQMEMTVARLERLLSILLDRADMDELEERLEKLEDFQRALGTLANEEGELRSQTDSLRKEAAGPELKELLESLRLMREEQRALLALTESSARESGTMDLEALERELERLITDQRTDLAVIESHDPEAASELHSAIQPLERARLEEARSERLRSAAEEIRAAAQRAESGETSAALEDLREAAAAAERSARTSKDSAAEAAAQALQQASAALERAQEDPDAASAATQTLEQAAATLEGAASEADATSEAARGDASRRLQDAADGDEASAPTQSAREALEHLEEAAQGASPEALSEAIDALRRAASDSERLPETLARSQRANSKSAERIQAGLERAAGEPSETESTSIQAALEKMEEAAVALEQGDPQASEEPAALALQALEVALAALQERRAAQAGDSASSSAQRQDDLAEDLASQAPSAQEAPVSPEARAETQSALADAAEAMRSASEALQESRPSSATSAQRGAMEALDRAVEALEEGVEPQTSEDKARAEEIAQRQEELRKRMYALKNQLEEDDAARDTSALERAQANAAAAEQALGQGDLAEAERQQEEAERNLREAAEELAEEKEDYQQLRDEELLFQIAEEVAQLLEAHQSQMRTTVELDIERAASGRPSRSQRLRLRKIAREELALSVRSGEVGEALDQEGSFVFAALVDGIRVDLERTSRDLNDEGGYQSGPRVQALQQDIEESLEWLLAALEEEKDRREEEEEGEEEEGAEEEQEGTTENRLVPNAAELRLLRRMEVQLLDGVNELLLLHPELLQEGDHDALLLEDIARLGHRHERTSGLFTAFRERLGIPDPDAEASSGPTITPIGEDESTPSTEGDDR